MKAFFTTAVLLCTLFSSLSYGAANVINGAAKFTNLRTDYYIGMLSLENKESSAQNLLDSQADQKLRLRVLEEWSPRRFDKLWHDAIFLNNNHDELLANKRDVDAFLNLPKSFLLPGDEITVDFSNGNTHLLINGHNVYQSQGKALFNVVLNAWIGSKPPSSAFKAAILGEKDSSKATIEFETITSSEERALVTQNWYQVATPATAKPSKPPIEPKTAAVINTAPIAPSVVETPQPKVEQASPSTAKSVAEAEQNVPPPVEIAQASAATEQTIEQPQEDQNALLLQYQQHIQSTVVKSARYPRRAEIAKEGDGLVSQMNPEGSVSFNLQLNRSGDILDIQEVSIADAEILNKFAVKALQKASLPAAPNALQGKIFQAPVTLTFQRNRVH